MVVGNLLQTRRTQVTLVEMAQQRDTTDASFTSEGGPMKVLEDVKTKLIEVTETDSDVEIEQLIISEICQKHDLFVRAKGLI